MNGHLRKEWENAKLDCQAYRLAQDVLKIETQAHEKVMNNLAVRLFKPAQSIAHARKIANLYEVAETLHARETTLQNRLGAATIALLKDGFASNPQAQLALDAFSQSARKDAPLAQFFATSTEISTMALRLGNIFLMPPTFCCPGRETDIFAKGTVIGWQGEQIDLANQIRLPARALALRLIDLSAKLKKAGEPKLAQDLLEPPQGWPSLYAFAGLLQKGAGAASCQLGALRTWLDAPVDSSLFLVKHAAGEKSRNLYQKTKALCGEIGTCALPEPLRTELTEIIEQTPKVCFAPPLKTKSPQPPEKKKRPATNKTALRNE